jgi:hypothetical protein
MNARQRSCAPLQVSYGFFMGKTHLECDCRLCPTLLDLKVGQLDDWTLET